MAGVGDGDGVSREALVAELERRGRELDELRVAVSGAVDELVEASAWLR